LQADDKICYCFHVPRRKIANFLRVERPQVASRISECGGAGTGCGWCVPFLKKYFQHWRDGTLELTDHLTPADYARQRARYIREGGGTPPAGATPLPELDKD